MRKLILAVVSAVLLIAGATTGRADGDWAYVPGTHNLSDSTRQWVWDEVQKHYAKVYPDAKPAKRAPRVGYTTAEGICTLLMSKKTSDCALALTCGEYGMCGLWDDSQFDVILDESVDYEGALGKTILYHEFWHFRQYEEHGPIMAEAESNCRENEAYLRQGMWARETGHDDLTFRIFMHLPYYPCNP